MLIMVRNISQGTMKILYSQSGEKCTKCRVPIVRKQSDGTFFQVGEIAHIRGSSPSSPRYDFLLTIDNANAEPNLMVLCPTCHTEIDTNESDYSVEKLLQMKEDHRQWVQSQLTMDSEGRDDEPELLHGVRKKYLDKICDYLALHSPFGLFDTIRFERLKNIGLGEYVDEITSQGIPDSITIVDGLVTYALERESKEQKGFWRKRLVESLNFLLGPNSALEQWKIVISRIPPRELEKIGITYSVDSSRFRTCRPRMNDGDTSPIFNKTDVEWFAELLKDPKIEKDLREGYILSRQDRSAAVDVTKILPKDLPLYLIQRTVSTHQANRLMDTLQYVRKKHIVHEELSYAIEVLREAQVDWGLRFQETNSSQPRVVEPNQKKVESQTTSTERKNMAITEESTETKQSTPFWVLVVFVYLTIIAGVSSNILADWISLGGLVSQIIWILVSVFAAIVLAWITKRKL